MAKTLGFIADRFLAAGHAAEVVDREHLSDALVRLVVRCPDFTSTPIVPGDATAWLAERNDFRHYTPAVIDGDELSIIIKLHGSGPGEQMLLALEPGSPLPMTKWASKRSFVWNDGDEPLVIVGDGTAISLAMQFQRRTGDTGRGFRAIIETPEADHAATKELLPGVEAVPTQGAPGQGLDDYLAAATFDGSEIFYLAGHGQSIQRQRDLLKSTFRVDRKSVRTQPFWADGKVGL